MKTDLTRQYELPKQVSNSTIFLLEKYENIGDNSIHNANNSKHFDNNDKNNKPDVNKQTMSENQGNNATSSPAITATNQSSTVIPDSQDLLNIRTELKALLPLSEKRIKDLERDLYLMDKNANNYNREGDSSLDKDLNDNVDKFQIKQEPDSAVDLHTTSSMSKNELGQQVLLETIRKRRRREVTDLEVPGESSTSSRHHTVKLKKLDDIPSFTYESTSPSPRSSTTATPASKQHQAKPNHNSKIAKKSGQTNARAQQLLLGELNSKQKSSHQNHIVPKEEKALDFIRVKPKDQVPIATFWSTFEPYFRNLTEEDREFLLLKPDNAKPYLVPLLGKYYLDQWAEEDTLIPGIMNSKSPTSDRRQRQDSTEDNNRFLQNGGKMKDDCLSYGTLTERLLSSLVAEELIDESSSSGGVFKSEEDDEDDEEEEDEDDDDDEEAEEEESESESESNHYVNQHGRTILEVSSNPTRVIVGFEERLKRELRYAGLFVDDDIDWNAREDDEICAELRMLGRELKEQVEINSSRKRNLLDVVDCQLQFEQYRQVLDTLDSQVEQGYMKRFRLQKAKKRKTGHKTMLSENAVYAIDKRKTWVNALGAIFKDKNMNRPTCSIYKDNEQNGNNSTSDLPLLLSDQPSE